VIFEQLRIFLAALKTERETDRHLLQLFVSERDGAAFAALLKRHGPMVLGVCRRILHDEQRAEDTFQATFLVLVRKAGSIRKSQSIASWLHGVALRLARKAKKAAVRAARPDARGFRPAVTDARSEASWRESLEILDEELQRLPENYRLPLVLCYLEGLTRDEAAARLGWTADKLRGCLERGRDRLRSRLIRRGVTLSTAASGVLLADTVLSAAVPSTLAVATNQAAAKFAAGTALTACGVSATVAALTEGGLKMVSSKKSAAILALAFFTVVLGSGVGIAQWTDLAKGCQPIEPAIVAVGQKLLKDESPTEDHSGGPTKDAFGDDLPPGAVARLGTTRWRHDDTVAHALFLPDGKTVISAGLDNTIRVWDFPSGKELRHFGLQTSKLGPFDSQPMVTGPGPSSSFRGALLPFAVSSDGKTVAACFGEMAIRRWDVATGNELRALTPKQTPKVPAGLSGVLAIAFSPDSTQLASLYTGGKIGVWDIATAKELRVFAGATKLPLAGQPEAALAYWAHDGRSLVAIGSEVGNAKKGPNTIKIWDPATGQEKGIFPNPGLAAWKSIAVSAKGNVLVAIGEDRSMTLFDIPTSKRIWKVDMKESFDTAVVFAPDGAKLYSWDSQTLHEWDAATGKELLPIGRDAARQAPFRSAPFRRPASLAVSPDGKTLAIAGEAFAIEFWDLTAKAPLRYGGHDAAVVAVSFTPDSKMVLTRSTEKQARRWEAATGKDIAGPLVFSPAFQSYNQITFSPLCNVIAAQKNPKLGLVLADATTGAEIAHPAPPIQKSTTQIGPFAPNGKVLARPRIVDKTIDLYDIPDLNLRCSITLLHAKHPFTMIFSPDAQTLAASYGPESIGIFDTTTGKKHRTITFTAQNAIADGAFSPDGRTLALDLNDGTIAVLELATGRQRRLLGQKQTANKPLRPAPKIGVSGGPIGPDVDPVYHGSVIFSPSGKLLVQGTKTGELNVWDATSGLAIAELAGHRGAVLALAIAPDGKTLVSGSADTTALIWDISPLEKALRPAKDVTPSALQAAWAALAAADAGKAIDAIADMTRAPKQALPFLKANLLVPPPVDAKRVEKLIVDFDDPQYIVRESATAELTKIGGQVVPFLGKALTAKPSLETKTRLETLRDQLATMELTREELRGFRAIEVLELIGTPEVRQLLQRLANGPEGTVLQSQAKAALGRIQR
jgi:RNA polymerase sigma factor (sigma-70 family)